MTHDLEHDETAGTVSSLAAPRRRSFFCFCERLLRPRGHDALLSFKQGSVGGFVRLCSPFPLLPSSPPPSHILDALIWIPRRRGSCFARCGCPPQHWSGATAHSGSDSLRALLATESDAVPSCSNQCNWISGPLADVTSLWPQQCADETNPASWSGEIQNLRGVQQGDPMKHVHGAIAAGFARTTQHQCLMDLACFPHRRRHDLRHAPQLKPSMPNR